MYVNDNDVTIEWRKFIKFGIKPKNVEQNILASWERSKDMGIDPYKCIPGARLTEKELKERITLKEDQIKIIIPYLNRIHEVVKGDGYLFYFADELGNILHIAGDDADISYFGNHYNFRNGVSCKEEIVGTTAPSLVLSDKIIVSHLSSAKYCLELKKTTCSALPLLGEDNEFIGILGVAANFKPVNKHILGILLSARMGIENQLRLDKQCKYLSVMNNYYGNIFESSPEAVLFVDNKGDIVSANEKALEIINDKPSEIIGKKVENVLDFPAVLFNNSVNDFSDRNCFIYTRDRKHSYKLKEQITCFKYSTHTNETINILKKDEINNTALEIIKKPYTNNLFKDLIGNSDCLLEVIDHALKACKSNSNILITGESGTGKELLAHSIHNESHRSANPFIAVNCGAVSRELAESEFFGYESGAFTGADKKGKKGIFEMARGGTVFLDEIGEMPKDMQTKLLRVLQNKKLTRIGGTKEILADFRLIAATNKNIEKEVKAGNFRADLYFRLNVIHLHMPNLMQRRSDIKELAKYFLKKHSQHSSHDIVISKEVIDALKKYDWPGNIRELENIIERAIVFLGDEQTITLKHLPDVFKHKSPCSNLARNGSLYDDEIIKIQNALKESGNNISIAARILGISRNTLYKRLKEYNITN